MLIYSMKSLYEHLLKTGNTAEINALVTSLAGTSADGLSSYDESVDNPETMLSLM